MSRMKEHMQDRIDAGMADPTTPSSSHPHDGELCALEHEVGARVQHPNAPKLRGTVVAVASVFVVWDETDVMRAVRDRQARDPRVAFYNPGELVGAVECEHDFKPVADKTFKVCTACRAIQDATPTEVVA
jgi:hypothetical protein